MTAGGEHGQPAAVRGRLGRAGVRSCSTRTEQDARPGQPAAARAGARARSRSRTSRSATTRTGRSSRTCRCRSSPGQTVAIVGPDRRRQDHAGQPADAVLRGDRRAGSPSTASTSPTMTPRGAAREHRHGAAGHLAVRRHDRREHRVRRRRPDPGADRGGGAGRARRPVHPDPARRLRHGHRRGGRRTSARARSSSSRSPGRSWPSRSILVLDEATSSVDTRTEVLIQRAMSSLRSGRTQLRHRAPPLHDPRRRRDPGDGARADRRAGHPRVAARRRRRVRPALRGPVRRRRWPRSTELDG